MSSKHAYLPCIYLLLQGHPFGLNKKKALTFDAFVVVCFLFYAVLRIFKGLGIFRLFHITWKSKLRPFKQCYKNDTLNSEYFK